MTMQWAPLLPLFQNNGIIAMGPMQTGPGCIPHAIVLRALSNGVTVAPNASQPAEYAVHVVAISDINGQLEFTDGNYLDASTDQPAAFALAWEKYEDRCRFSLSLPRK